MSKIIQDYTEKYLRELIPDNTGILKDLEEFAEKNSVPIVHKETANFLRLMISIKKPKKILELGTAIGYSSILMGIMSNNTVKITTVERDKNMISMAKENIKKAGLNDNINIIEGDCMQVLDEIKENFDLIFMDAGKGHYNHFLPYCIKNLNKDGIIIADNVLFRGMVPCNDLVKRRKITIVKRMREYLDMVNEKEFLTSILPLGDGVSVTVRRNENE